MSRGQNTDPYYDPLETDSRSYDEDEDVRYSSRRGDNDDDDDDDDEEQDYYENSQRRGEAYDEDPDDDNYRNRQQNNGYYRDDDDDDDDDQRRRRRQQEERPVAYADQPYLPSQDTGAGMMVYDEKIEDDPAYDYDPEEDDRNERAPMMPDDYYKDEPGDEEEYYDEDEDERRRRTRRRRAWCCCLMLLCCLLILIILLLIFLLRDRDDPEDDRTPAPTNGPYIDDTDDDFYYDDDIILRPGVITSYMAPIDNNCIFDDQPDFAHVWDQCNCDGVISDVPDDVGQMRQLIIDKMAHKFYEDDDVIDSRSCDPRNMALIWLASGNNRDSGEPRQRFALALSYFQLNGTIWDYDDEWLSELNECLWLGVQCNNRDSINSMAVDTNNLFGLVRFFFFDSPIFPR